MIMFATCSICNKPVCEFSKPTEDDGAHNAAVCHGHESEGEKKCVCSCHDPNSLGESKKKHCRYCPTYSTPQPKVCERCGGKGYINGDKCNCWYRSEEHSVHPCEDCSPLPPKDGKGEEGWEEKVHKIVDQVKGDHNALYILPELFELIRQVAAQAREDGYSKAIEDAMEAVRVLKPIMSWKFEGAVPPAEKAVLVDELLSALDKLKKK